MANGQFNTGDPILDEGLSDVLKVQKKQINEAGAQGVDATSMIAKLLQQSEARQRSVGNKALIALGAGLTTAGGGDASGLLSLANQKGSNDSLGSLAALLNAQVNQQKFQQQAEQFQQNQQILANAGVISSNIEQQDTLANQGSRVQKAQERLSGFQPQVSRIGESGAPTIDFDTEKEIVERSLLIGQRFDALQEVKDFRVIRGQVSQMDSLLSEAIAGNLESNLALDQSLIITFNRINDPTSVVRESEFARTPEGISLVNRFRGAFQRLQQGGSGLTNEDRAALVQGAKIIANERGKDFNRAIERTRGRIKRAKADEQIVFGDIIPHESFDTSAPQFPGNTNTQGPIEENIFDDL